MVPETNTYVQCTTMFIVLLLGRSDGKTDLQFLQCSRDLHLLCIATQLFLLQTRPQTKGVRPNRTMVEND